MRHHGARCLVPRQPRRQDRALAHPWAPREHDPTSLARPVEAVVEPCQHILARDEPLVSFSLCREVDQPRLLR